MYSMCDLYYVRPAGVQGGLCGFLSGPGTDGARIAWEHPWGERIIFFFSPPLLIRRLRFGVLAGRLGGDERSRPPRNCSPCAMTGWNVYFPPPSQLSHLLPCMYVCVLLFSASSTSFINVVIPIWSNTRLIRDKDSLEHMCFDPVGNNRSCYRYALRMYIHVYRMYVDVVATCT